MASSLRQVDPCPAASGNRKKAAIARSLTGVRVSAFCVVLLAGLSSVAHGGDILRGGAVAASGRQAADSRGNAGTQAAELAKTHAADRLARTTKVISDMRQMQAAARAAAGAAAVGNGLYDPVRNPAGGLKILAGANAKWVGAAAPVASGNSVQITQNSQQAFLHWETFNVGRDTSLYFDQSAGGSDSGKWIAFNKIFDPGTVPSQILGSIKADGQVYVINRNGIVFGAGSQVSTRTFVASSLPINDTLVMRGLLNQQAGNVEFLFSALPSDGFDAFKPNSPVGDVVVEKGAFLGSPVSPEGYGGRVMLAGNNVRNRGIIATPAGQTILAAGLQVGIDAHTSSDPSLRGLDVYVGAVADATLNPSGGEAANEGLIESARGSIVLAGKRVFQRGVLDSSTSVDVNGRIDLLANFGALPNRGYNPTQPAFGPPFLNSETGLVEFGESSVTRILPEWGNDKTIARSALPLRSEIHVQGRTIHLGKGSVIQAPNAKVDMDAGEWVYEPSTTSPRTTFVYSSGQIYLDEGSLLDVSGSTDVFVPLAQSIITLQLRGSELADSPLQRSANLRAVDLTIDMRLSGSFYGRQWVGTPLGDATGYLNLIERNVGQLTLEGGDVTMKAGGSVVIRKGAAVDASGGYARNEGGRVQTTRVKLGPNLINIENAFPDRIYGGIYDGHSTSASVKWGVKKTYVDSLAPLGGWGQREYLSGANAGSILIASPSMALDGELLGRRVVGPRQLRSSPLSSNLPGAGRLELAFEGQDRAATNPKFGTISPTPPRISFVDGIELPSPDAFAVSADDLAPPLPATRTGQVIFSPAKFAESGLGELSIRNADGDISIPAGTTLQFPAGGTLKLEGANVAILGNVVAPGGTINVTAYNFSPYLAKFLNVSAGDVLPAASPNRGVIRVASGSTISAAGLLQDDRVTAKFGAGKPVVLNGGTVSLEAFSVDLEPGSSIDVSGGIIFGANGKSSSGNAGSISISAGQDPNLSGILGGHLSLGGRLAGFSTKTGGSLSIKAPLVQVGGSSSRADTLVVQPDFFNRGGFSSFALAGIGAVDPGGDTIPGLFIFPGTDLEPVVTSWAPVPYGRGGIPGFREVVKPQGSRDPVSLSFRATGASDNLTQLPLVRGDLVFGEGATIRVDPLGEVRFAGETAAILGSVFAPGGRISISGANTFPIPSPEPIALATVYIGPRARLSAAGTTLLTPDPFGRKRGSVLAGGSIQVAGNILAEAGAVLDVSGSSDFLDLTPAELGLTENPRVSSSSGVNAELASLKTTRTRVDSNGGEIVLKGSKLLISNATLIGRPGGPSAVGGSLAVSSGRFVAQSESSTSADINLLVQQDGPLIPVSTASFGAGGKNFFNDLLRNYNAAKAVPGAIAAYKSLVPYGGAGFFAADSFLGGGFASLELGGNIHFRGAVSIAAAGSLLLGSGGVIEADSTVKLSAPYIRVGQKFPNPRLPDQQQFLFTQTDGSGITTEYHPTPSSGPGQIALSASLVDVGTLLMRNIAAAEFAAPGGDIRGNGVFVMAGNLVLEAGQIYPATAATFDIFAYDNTVAGTPGSVTIKGSGARPLPLSAGGHLRVMASIISQGGTLRAPAGMIGLGWDGLTDRPVNKLVGDGTGAPATPATTQLILSSSSLVSVSAIDPFTNSGVVIPYGLSPDGLTWIDPSGVDVTLKGLPAKAVAIGAQKINMSAGATVDIRGGGDLFAYQWIQGLGGFEDILASESSFAVIPGYAFHYSPSAPFNPSADSLLGDAGYVNSTLHVGDTITLKGSGVLSAGSYTLLPARYALLPGAVLVTPFSKLGVPSNDPLSFYGTAAPGNIALEDGSYLVSGYRSNALASGKGQPATYSTFQVLSNDAVRARSQYRRFFASDFLKNAAADHGQVSQRLPSDAGNVKFFASTGLDLSGRVLAAAAGGRGASADIAVAGDISITGGGAKAPAGAIGLSAATLSSWGIESLLLGGVRDGSNLQVRSASITLDNRGSAFSGPEIILAAKQSLVLADGASLASSGTMSEPAANLTIVGDGALVRVSGDRDASVQRTGFSNVPTTDLRVGAGVSVRGTSVTLDSTFGTRIDPLATLVGTAVNLNSGRISLLLDNPGSAAPTFGLVLGGSALASLANAGDLALLSYSSLDFYGTGNLPLGNPDLLVLSAGAIRGFGQAGGTVTVSAGEIRLDNTQGASVPADEQSMSGTLLLDVQRLRTGTNAVAIRQFSDTVLDAPGGLFGAGVGGLETAGNLRGSVSEIHAAAAARQTLSAGGSLVLSHAAGSSAFVSGLGAGFTISGKSVSVNSDIFLPSGRLEVNSSGGGLALGGLTDLSGTSQTFVDASRFTNGGTAILSATGGDVAISGTVNVSAASGGGDAGSLQVSAPGGGLFVTGQLAAARGSGGNSGSFSLDAKTSGAAGAFDSLNESLDASGFSESRSFRVRTGDLRLAATAKARHFSMFADSGSISVSGTIDASGTTGGTIDIAANGDLRIENGALLTVEGKDFNHAGKGGTITLEAGAQQAGSPGPGTVVLASGAKLDLSVLSNDSAGPGTSAFYGKFTGQLHIRAPQNAAGTDLQVAAIGATIQGASSILVEGFKVTDLSNPAGSSITSSTQSAVMADGIAFASNIGDINSAGSITRRLLANNVGLAGEFVLAPGAEIINRTGALTVASDWDLSSFRFGPKNAPGVLTLRAAGDLSFQGSLSDGFSGGSSLWLSPLMANNPLLPVNAQSWSYRLTAGADTNSANFRSTAGASGSVKIGLDYGSASVGNPGSDSYTPDIVEGRYQAIRTGSGDISITAAGSVQLLNQFAAVFTAGTQVATPNSLFAPGDFSIPDTTSFPNKSDSYILGVQQQVYGPQYSMAGGNVDISAGKDIARLTRSGGSLIDDSSRELPMNWLYRRSYVDPQTKEYGRSGVQLGFSGSRKIDDPSSSTTWWIDFSNFFEGVGALGGGNVSLLAGNDIRNIDAVAPTNARSPSGKPDSSRLVELGGGDVRVAAGHDISGGVYYVERGNGNLLAGASVTTNSARSPSLGIVGQTNNLNDPVLLDSSTWLATTLFLGRGGFDIQAGGDVLLGPVANPFMLPQGIGNKYWYKTYFSTYGSDSYVNVLSLGGDITHRTETTLKSDTGSRPALAAWMATQNIFNTLLGTSAGDIASNYQPWLRLSESDLNPFQTVFGLMAPTLRSTALSGSIHLEGNITLYPSATGSMELVAAGSIAGLSVTGISETAVAGSETKLWKSSTINISDTNPAALPGVLSPIAYFSTQDTNTTSGLPTGQIMAQSTGLFLDSITAAFSESGSTTGTFGVVQTQQTLHSPGLLHASDTGPVRLYAAGGDIAGLTLFSPKSTQVVAGTDISDVAFYIQNLSKNDVSFVSAGGSIIPYNPNTPARVQAGSPGNLLVLNDAVLPGDIQISGPGSLEVLAGRNLDLGTGQPLGADLGVGITSIGNARNPFLPFEGAALFVGAGLGPSAGLGSANLEVDAFLDKYLGRYQQKLAEGSDGATLEPSAMTPAQRAQLALRVLALVLRDTGRDYKTTGSYGSGYAAIETLFTKASAGGDINTRARDIRTKSGGEINLFVPSGALILAKDAAGQTARRPSLGNFAGTGSLMLVSTSTAAVPSGIVTEYGGDISIFSHGSVEIGNGRIFTLRGGNIIIWSSTGDIAAGAASKTVATAPPTRVLIDPQSATVETDLSGLATGGGIGVLDTVAGIKPGDVDLIAPVGTVDAGDAGIRATGNLNIAAVKVLNADNISVAGSSAGVPGAPAVAAPNVGGLTSASSSSAAANSAANSVSNQARENAQPTEEAPSTITVEVLGYGGGDTDEG